MYLKQFTIPFDLITTYHCVYFLYFKTKIVYIGSSKNSLFARLGIHKKEKIFDEIKVYQYQEEREALEAEQAFISYFNPKYNRYYTYINYDIVQSVLNNYFGTNNVTYKIFSGSEVTKSHCPSTEYHVRHYSVYSKQYSSDEVKEWSFDKLSDFFHCPKDDDFQICQTIVNEYKKRLGKRISDGLLRNRQQGKPIG